MYNRAIYELEDLRDRFRWLRQENDHLRSAERDLRPDRDVLGDKMVDQAILTAETTEQQLAEQQLAEQRRKHIRNRMSL